MCRLNVLHVNNKSPRSCLRRYELFRPRPRSRKIRRPPATLRLHATVLPAHLHPASAFFLGLGGIKKEKNYKVMTAIFKM